MARSFAVLTVPDSALVRWPDGRITYAADLPAGTRLEIHNTVAVEGGRIAWAVPVDDPDVFALVDARDLDFEGRPVQL